MLGCHDVFFGCCGVRLCGLCDFFVLLCFVCSHQHSLIAILWWLLCWLCVRYLGRMVDALAC